MKHEDIVDLWDEISISLSQFDQKVEDVLSPMINQAFEALLSEAWHPIEKAEELKAKDGREVLLGWISGGCEMGTWNLDSWETNTCASVRTATHFRFINPPEGA